jgi:putative ABC transport system permease protein
LRVLQDPQCTKNARKSAALRDFRPPWFRASRPLPVFERTRELGLLRAVGTTRRQVRAIVRWESVIVSVLGALLGAVLGLVFGAALTRGLAGEGLSVLDIPGERLGSYVLAAAFAGVLAAIGPARRAAKVDVLQAVSAT